MTVRRVGNRFGLNRGVHGDPFQLTLADGFGLDGEPEVPGLWIANNEGAKFRLSVMNNLRNRGVEDILIAVVDGLKGFPDAINAAFPDTTVQTCIVHPVRHSLNFCGWKDRKIVAKDLKRIYQCYR